MPDFIVLNLLFRSRRNILGFICTFVKLRHQIIIPIPQANSNSLFSPLLTPLTRVISYTTPTHTLINTVKVSIHFRVRFQQSSDLKGGSQNKLFIYTRSGVSPILILTPSNLYILPSSPSLSLFLYPFLFLPYIPTLHAILTYAFPPLPIQLNISPRSPIYSPPSLPQK
jgi:hypothetical protein